MSEWEIRRGDCLEVLAGLEPDSIDAIVTDPPYLLGFMGKKWDSQADQAPWHQGWAKEALRILKPGGHLVAFGGTRTYHHLAYGIEAAGFEIRDCLQWLYGSGFPKSHDVSKAIDKAAGAEREVLEEIPDRWTQKGGVLNFSTDRPQRTVKVTGDPATDDAQKWEGWGTALKPSNEPIVLARKPFEATVAQNVLEHGTGALNIDGCRIGKERRETWSAGSSNYKVSNPEPWKESKRTVEGRWPANTILDPEAGAILGGHSRFFYCAKASQAERNGGLSSVEPRANHHPTVKPVSLMRWLVRLVTPPDGLILDPFTGSGTTGIAAVLEGFRFLGIERESEYVELAKTRIEYWGDQSNNQFDLRDTEVA